MEKEVKEVVDELGMDVEVEKVQDMAKIMEYKVMMTPSLVINGKVVSSGHVPSKSDVKKMILEAKG